MQALLAYTGILSRCPAEWINTTIGPDPLSSAHGEHSSTEHAEGASCPVEGTGNLSDKPWQEEDQLNDQLSQLIELGRDQGSSPSLGEGCEVGVAHISQTYTWDCGIACLQMILE
jgi:hypothetical protein